MIWKVNLPRYCVIWQRGALVLGVFSYPEITDKNPAENKTVWKGKGDKLVLFCLKTTFPANDGRHLFLEDKVFDLYVRL